MAHEALIRLLGALSGSSSGFLELLNLKEGLRKAQTGGSRPGGHPPETLFSKGKIKIRLYWLIMTRPLLKPVGGL